MAKAKDGLRVDPVPAFALRPGPGPHVGGSYAPPLSDEKLAEYKKRIKGMETGPVKEACETLLKTCEKWWELPEPAADAARTPHPAGQGTMVMLATTDKETLDELIPWKHELDAIQGLLDTIPADTQKADRDTAFHLLWHVKELDLGREPITTDKL